MVKNLQNKLPIFLSVGAVSALLGLSTIKLRDWEGIPLAMAIALVALYLVWLVVESRVAMKEVDKGQTRLDKGTLELYAFGRFATACTAMAFSDASLWNPAKALFGFALFIFAVVLRLVAIRELGRFYSHRVRLAGDHKIVSTGPYRILRHPAYTGMLLAHLGLVIFFFDWVSLLMLAGVLLPAIVLRIRVEEKALMEIDGYPDFSRGRPRLIPLVW